MTFSSFFDQTVTSKNFIIDDAQKKCVDIIDETLTKWNRFYYFQNIFKFFFNSPRGIYIYGPVGTGKTTIMDLLFSYVMKKKHRDHFKPFMLNFHRKGYEETLSQFKKMTYLFLDELEIIDISDALIVNRLFKELSTYGVKIITTSNIPPKDLYKNGLHFDRFKPFITYVEDNYTLLKLDNGIDYRLINETEASPFALEKEISKKDHVFLLDKNIPFKEEGGAVIFSFDILCGDTLGPVHYQALVNLYNFIHIEGIPPLFTKAENDSLRRFITLVDFFYDQGKIIKIMPNPYLSIDSDILLPKERLQSRLIEMFHTPVGTL